MCKSIAFKYKLLFQFVTVKKKNATLFLFCCEVLFAEDGLFFILPVVTNRKTLTLVFDL